MVHPDSFAPWQLNYISKDAHSVPNTEGRNDVARAKQYRSSCNIRGIYWNYRFKRNVNNVVLGCVQKCKLLAPVLSWIPAPAGARHRVQRTISLQY